MPKFSINKNAFLVILLNMTATALFVL